VIKHAGFLRKRLLSSRRHSREEEVAAECIQCGAGEEEAFLYKCPICHKMVCEECRFMKSGQTFCSRGCGEMFFHQEDDEMEDEG
jgi:hypothetical protein